MSSLEYVYENDNADNILIFIHGFLGGKNSFVNENKEHLFDLLPATMKTSFACANFLYTANLFDKKLYKALISRIPLLKYRYKCNRTIPECAELLLTHCDILSQKHDNICLIGHSMGGLVGSWAALKLSSLKKYNNISVITFATPHNGVESAVIGRLIHNNSYLNDLSPLSEVINQLETEWSRKAPQIQCKYFVGHDDDIVPIKSCVPRYSEEEPIRVDGCHETVVKPIHSNSIIVGKIINVLNEFMPPTEERLIKHLNRKPNPLFQSYRRIDEKYYIKREVDDIFFRSLKRSNVWICGGNGVGKTTLIQRNVIYNDFQIYYVDLSVYRSITREELVRAICSIVSHQTSDNCSSFSEALPEQEIIKKICKNLLSLGGSCMHCIVVDEYHNKSIDVLRDVLDTATSIANAYKNINQNENVRFVFSSPFYKKHDNDILNGRFSQLFRVLSLQKWTEDELANLLKLVNEKLCFPISSEETKFILKKSMGSPRKLKQILDAIHFQYEHNDTISVENTVSEIMFY